MAGEIRLNTTTMATESSGTITLSNVNSATNRTNLGLEIGVDVQQYDVDTTKNDVANTFTANQIISVTDNTNAALRVTQLGTGNALVVEDSANPDSTPFIVNASGIVTIGGSSALTSSILTVDGSGKVANGIASKVNNNVYYTYVGLNPTGTETFLVYGDGDVVNTNNSYGAISDVKLKENIVDTTPKLDDLKQVRIVNYNLIENPDKKLLGVIAQELEQIFPNIVSETPDLDDEGNDLGTTTKSVKYSVFVPMLIKAIQEQQALIESQQSQIDALTARIETLETT